MTIHIGIMMNSVNMKTTRHSTFETNSSSTHSIVISNDTEVYLGIAPDYDGNIELTGGEFGWEWRRYTDPLTKANYCAVACGENEEMQQMLISVIMEHTGAKQVIMKLNGSGIDHQSAGTANPAFQSPENLKDFIFNPKSVLFTGNDNSSPFPNFYDVDISEKTHKLSLEGSDMPCYVTLSELKNRDKLIEIIHSLYERNRFNKFSSINQGYFKPESMEYSMAWRNTDIIENFGKNILKIVCERYNSRLREYETIEEKNLLFTLEKLDTPLAKNPYYTT